METSDESDDTSIDHVRIELGSSTSVISGNFDADFLFLFLQQKHLKKRCIRKNIPKLSKMSVNGLMNLD